MICSILRTTVLLLLGICLLAPCGLAAQDTTATTSRMQGSVFSGAPDEPLYRPGAKVTLYGDTGVISTITDRDGKFSFADVEPPGGVLPPGKLPGSSCRTERNGGCRHCSSSFIALRGSGPKHVEAVTTLVGILPKARDSDSDSAL